MTGMLTFIAAVFVFVAFGALAASVVWAETVMQQIYYAIVAVAALLVAILAAMGNLPQRDGR